MKDKSLSNLIVHSNDNQIISEFVHDQLKAFILSKHYTCVGAKASFKNKFYSFSLYEEMNSEKSTRILYHDLKNFIDNDSKRKENNFSTFIASFKTPNIVSELCFENLLWEQLQKIHDMDTASKWDPAVSSDPENSLFSFSFQQKSFFIVGLNPVSSRWSRRFSWPTLVFNSHTQFEELRKNGSFYLMQRQNRLRDKKLQGSINPNLADFGEASEARQYSGRHVENNWKCPFHNQYK